MTDFVFAETKGVPGAPLVVTFHGTGGDEHQFHGLATQLLPAAHVISPRGTVSEHGALRFFRRTSEGIYDMDDLAGRTGEMAGFLRAATARLGAQRIIALGYSNGANIAASVALSHPEIFSDLVLMHPLIPWDPDPQPCLSDIRALITTGRNDPICPPKSTETLINYLRAQGSTVTDHWHPGGHEITDSELAAISDFVMEKASQAHPT